MIRRALISVSDKTGIVEFARQLAALKVEIISTGGTEKLLAEQKVPVRPVHELTDFPEMLDGRVKTLHPHIHGGILARRDLAAHMATLEERQIKAIDLVVCNLYPFAATIAQPGVSLAQAMENVDIGGPTMLRAAAKNHAAVAVIVKPQRYQELIAALQREGEISIDLRRQLALEAFQHTAHYDSLIASYLQRQYAPQAQFPQELTLGFQRQQELRYGENPHQAAAFYKELPAVPGSLATARQLQGKELSFCNINDADAALGLVKSFKQPAAVAVKHANPCGVALAADIIQAYKRAHDADPVSIFGGIVALNRGVDDLLAVELAKIFLDIIIAPAFSEAALAILGRKKNLRLLLVEDMDLEQEMMDYKRVAGGLLVQTADSLAPQGENWQQVSSQAVSQEQLRDMHFAWPVVKYAKSNAIVVVKDGVTLGIGMGQVNRIDAAQHALKQAGEKAKGAILASDGLFPFPDVVEAAAAAGIAALVQPGGSIRDEESIAAADRHGLAMIFTGFRHFRH